MVQPSPIHQSKFCQLSSHFLLKEEREELFSNLQVKAQTKPTSLLREGRRRAPAAVTFVKMSQMDWTPTFKLILVGEGGTGGALHTASIVPH